MCALTYCKDDTANQNSTNEILNNIELMLLTDYDKFHNTLVECIEYVILQNAPKDKQYTPFVPEYMVLEIHSKITKHLQKIIAGMGDNH